MYYYIYDASLENKQYNQVVARVETRLTDLGINGKISHLSFLKNIQQTIDEEIKRGVKTIVVVGNDKTLGQVINLIADFNITLGLIPIDGKNDIAKLLGIPEGEKACDVLSSRIIKKIDLGKVNNYYFITSLEMSGNELSLECDNSYFLNPEKRGSIIRICNLDYGENGFTSPDDDILDVFLETPVKTFLWKKKMEVTTHLKVKEARITGSKSLPITIVDDNRIIKTPATIKVSPKKIKFIVGKSRQF